MALNKSLSADTINAINLLQDAMKPCFEQVDTKAYSSIKPLLAQLGSRLAENALVVVAAEPQLFYSAKNLFCKALNLRMLGNDQITAALPVDYSPKTEQEYRLVTEFPADADIFVSANGLFTGFAVKSGSQTIAFLPLETKRLEALTGDSFGAFLKANYSGSDDSAFDTHVIPDDDAGMETPAPESTAPAHYLATVAAVRELRFNDVKLAMAKCGPWESVQSLTSGVTGSENFIVFDSVAAEKWLEGEFDEYFPGVARAALERCGTDFAGAISPLYSGENNEKFMFTVLTDGKTADIKKVTGTDSGEIVVDSICGFMKAVEEAAKAHEGNPIAENVKIIKKPKAAAGGVEKSKAPTVIAIIGVVLAIILSVAVGWFTKDIIKPDEPETTSEIITEYIYEIETETETEAESESETEEGETLEGESEEGESESEEEETADDDTSAEQ